MLEETFGTGPVLVIGCGYLGRRVADSWRDQGRPVYVLTRSRAEELACAGFHPVTGDVTDPASLAQLPAVETVLYAVGLDRQSGKSMQEVYVQGLAHVLDRLPAPRKWIYVSSTSVYAQADGAWVEETSATEPVEHSGQVVLAAEQTLRQGYPEAIILRFSGIYGPGRLLRQAALLRGEPLVGDAEKWLNLIHVADGVQAVLAAEQHASPGSLYNIADDHPVTRRAFYTHLAELLGAPTARFEPGPSGRGEGNRRIRNARARAELHFVPQFPSYREGLAASLPTQRG